MLTHFSISQQGEKHIQAKTPCQDYSKSKRIQIGKEGKEYVLAAIADGVGSCEFSQEGARVAVESWMACVEHNLSGKEQELTDETIQHLLEYSFKFALAQVEKEADSQSLPFLEFDSTLTGCIYDGKNLWFGHIGDDGIVALYCDGTYEMITTRHKGEEVHSVFPLRNSNLWQFGKASKDVASLALMTDGVLDYCVGFENMNNRIYFPFLEPALTTMMHTDEEAKEQKEEWEKLFDGSECYPQNFREQVTDDISFVIVENSEAVKQLPEIAFDFEKWDEDSARRRKEVEDVLYAEYRAYKESLTNKPIVEQPEEVLWEAVDSSVKVAKKTFGLWKKRMIALLKELEEDE